MTDDRALFALTLLGLKGVGRRTTVAALERYADEAGVRGASSSALVTALGKRAAATLEARAASDWIAARDQAVRTLDLHTSAGVTVLAHGGDGYPQLLAASPDAPAVLYARGDLSALDGPVTVAIVGTREPTIRGREIARRIARRFAEGGAVVVSGLARGIDTAAHEGALEAGRTVAVLGTAIDKVYPAENKDLSWRIERDGALVSEYPIGFQSRADDFVDRDRIQAWLSLAVIPVQTRTEGGTLHTVEFAADAGRPVYCPRPVEPETEAPENAGIVELLRTGRALPLDADGIAGLLADLADARRRTASPAPHGHDAGTASGRAAESGEPAQIGWLLPGAAEPAPAADPPKLRTMDEVVAALDAALDHLGPNYDEAAFDDIVRAWRRRRYPRR